jgi:hypothetical protein
VRLLRAEWSRLFARRFTRIMLVVVAALLGLIGTGVALSSERPGPAVVARAEQQASRVRADVAAERAACEATRASPPPTADAPGRRFPSDCSKIDPAQVRAEDFMPRVFSFRDEASELLMVLGALLAMLGFAVGASFVGAEWSSGGMTNLLLWQPRRLAVLGGKLAALVTGVTAVSAVFTAGWLAALYAIAGARGRIGTVTTGVAQSLALDAGRAWALALAAAVIGFCVASLGRHTAMALGLAVGWGLVLEIGLRIVLAIVEAAKPERYLASSYAAAWLGKGVRFTDFSSCRFVEGDCQPVEWGISMGTGGWAVLAATALAAFAAFAAMRRRDVT